MRAAYGTGLLLALITTGFAARDSSPGQQYAEDFDLLWNEIDSTYAYFDKKTTDWAKVKALYRPQATATTTREGFIALLETVLEELCDHHAHLNTNTASSPRLVPSGADIWGEWKNGRAMIVQVRRGSNAERAGLHTGMEIGSIEGVEIVAAVDRRLGKAIRTPNSAARNWALRALLAGRHNQPRRIGVRLDEGQREVAIDDHPSEPTNSPDKPLLMHQRLGNDRSIGYIRIHNSLGSIGLIKEFDLSLGALRNSAGLILDLRDTPSGGNTTVARGIMGRFVEREGYYQRHSIPSEERQFGVPRTWAEIVSPRGEFRYGGPLVMLVDHWTGSMGEGIAIGLDGLKRATIVGTPMAGLLGATSGITLPNSKIGVNFPTEKLFHVNGTPREEFVPTVTVDLLKNNKNAKDAVLEAGLRTLQELIKQGPTK